MEKDSQKNVVNHFAAGSNCQVFNGNITGCVFAMPGSTVTQQQAPVNQQPQAAVAQDRGQPDVVMLARAIENCQEYFWGNSAYAVVYCVCRDDYKQKDLTQSGFERMVEMLPYSKKRDYTCTTGTIANAFCHNSLFKTHVSRWELQGASERILKLLNQLRKELEL